MPTTRQRRARGRTVVTLDALDVADILSFLSGWHPPESDFERKRSRWQDWQAFDREYELLRDEFLASEWIKPGEVPFAEHRYQDRHQGV